MRKNLKVKKKYPPHVETREKRKWGKRYIKDLSDYHLYNILRYVSKPYCNNFFMVMKVILTRERFYRDVHGIRVGHYPTIKNFKFFK